MKTGYLRTALFTLFLAVAMPALVPGQDADDLVLAGNGNTEYQVLLPDSPADEGVAETLKLAARLIQSAFKANGIDLSVTNEAGKAEGKSGLYLGDTEFARANGVDVSGLKGWNYIQRVAGDDIIIAGRDQAPPPVPEGFSRRPYFYRAATLKGVLDFLRSYCGTYCLYPGPNALPSSTGQKVSEWDLLATPTIEYRPMEKMEVPADLDNHQEFFVDYNFRITRFCTLYDIANNLFPKVDDASLAHTYGSAVPPDKYRETDPEFFALIGGERYTGNQYCVSNPEFQELLYEWTRKWLDLGFNSVSILQPDGFRPCQCEECEALYGTGNDWGEKLWIFHRRIGERLLKEHPDKAYYIWSYTVTGEPPETFDALPPNTGLSVQGSTPDNFEKFACMKIPRGFAVGIHNWIANQTSRYTPQRTPLFVQNQVRLFHDKNVRGVFRDGLGEVYGLEGPTFYVYGRMFEDPENLDARTLMFEYCEAAFGNAAGPVMRRFYDDLYHNIELYSQYLNTHGVGWTYKDIYGRSHKAVQNPFRMLGFLYTPELLDKLEKHLSAAEKKAKDQKHKTRLGLVRRELDYLKALMRVVRLYRAYQVEPTLDTRERLLDAIDDRNALIATYYHQEEGQMQGRTMRVGDWPQTLFPPPGHNAAHLRLAHNTYGNAFADTCLNWDTEAMRKAPLPGTESLASIPATGEITIDSGEWEQAPMVELKSVDPAETPECGTTVRVLYDAEKVYLRFESALAEGQDRFEDLGKDADPGKSESVGVYLAPDPSENIYYRFTVGPAEGSRFDAARGLITDKMNLKYNRDDDEWNGEWEYKSHVDADADTWQALISVPYQTIGVDKPEADTKWRANFGRTHAVDEEVEQSIWSSLGSTRDIGDVNALGELVFKADSESASKADEPEESPEAKWRREWYSKTFDVPEKWKRLENPLPEPLGPWVFRLDPIEKGVKEEWYLAETGTSEWEPIQVPAFWNEFKWGRYEGQAWYRTVFKMPADWKGKPMELLFGSVDEEAWVYVNGRQVGEHSMQSTGKTVNQLWEEPFAVEVPADVLNYGGDNTLAVRVNNTRGGGGIWRPVLGHRQ